MSKRSMALKERLKRGETTIGAWLSFTDPAVAELMSGVGFDWLLMDTEHAPYTLERLETTLMAFNGRETVPIVRVPWNNRVFVKQALDLGAEGILIPYVCSPEEAREAVALGKYPPAGVRGFGPRRASDYYRWTDEYIRTANDSLLTLIQIEHIQAVESIGQILAVPGIDVVLMGPQDLSASMGLLGQVEDPRVQEAISRVIQEAHKAKIPVGVPMDVDIAVAAPNQWIERGCQFIFAGEDHSFLRRIATRTLAECRRQVSEGKELH